MDLDMTTGMDIDDHMNTKMKMEEEDQDHGMDTVKETASSSTVTTRPHANSDLTRTPSLDPASIITAATPTPPTSKMDTAAYKKEQPTPPRLSAPDSIGSSVRWSNTSSAPAPVRTGGMHPASTARVSQHPAATAPATAVVSSAVAPVQVQTQTSAVATSAAAAATRHT